MAIPAVELAIPAIGLAIPVLKLDNPVIGLEMAFIALAIPVLTRFGYCPDLLGGLTAELGNNKEATGRGMALANASSFQGLRT